MLVAIRHTTHYSYDAPGSFAVQRLRLTPSDNRAQRVLAWRIDADGIEDAAEYTDGFGNCVHLITHCEPYDKLTITAEGEVETADTGGVLGDALDAGNPRVFLRSTKLTESSPALDELARDGSSARTLDRLHRLLETIAGRVAYVTDSTTPATSADQALNAGKGVCQDHAHIFIAAARSIDVPARYVTGYLHMESEAAAGAQHAWAEAWAPDLGWVGFDPANHICPTERYVRLACGFDAVSAAPISGTRRGGGAESLEVDVVVRQQQQ